ncbi:MAG: hypothetical protein RLZZ350_2145 [Verrucomicrobiota bacterium]|jgi:hypothetical protein
MKISQSKWTAAAGWTTTRHDATTPNLVFVFGATAALKNSELLTALHKKNPGAQLFGCSTAGEICGTEVSDDSVVATAIQFEQTGLHLAHISLADAGGSAAAGEQVARALPPTVNVAGKAEKLSHVLMLSDGLKTNGTELLAGMTRALPTGVCVTGGLAGDGARFAETLVVWDGVAQRDAVVAVGLYGKNLRVGYSAFGGWDAFGPERKITKSLGNVLYEFDGQSALALYKKYLGEQAKDLPGSGLLFPLSLRTADGETGVVRTILAVDEATQSMTFAGDVPEGSYARLMKANFDRLIDGAGTAATASKASAPELAVLISCVGRKLVLKQRIEEEVEAVRDVMGADTVLTGFYSYGEVSPFGAGGKCELHNQTMTIIHLSEK